MKVRNEMKQVVKFPVESLRTVRVGHMLTTDYMKPTMHAVTVTAVGIGSDGVPWAELTDRKGVSILVNDTDLDKHDLKAVTHYV